MDSVATSGLEDRVQHEAMRLYGEPGGQAQLRQGLIINEDVLRLDVRIRLLAARGCFTVLRESGMKSSQSLGLLLYVSKLALQVTAALLVHALLFQKAVNLTHVAVCLQSLLLDLLAELLAPVLVDGILNQHGLQIRTVS